MVYRSRFFSTDLLQRIEAPSASIAGEEPVKFDLQESWCFTIQSRNSCDSLPKALSVSLQTLQDLLRTTTSSTWPVPHAQHHSNHSVRRHKSTMRPGTVTCNRNINNIIWIVTLQSWSCSEATLELSIRTICTNFWRALLCKE